jgi:hypothetical protein
MRFPTHFQRIKPTTPGTPTLGSDTLPSTPSATADNLFIGKFTSTSGFPVQSLAIGYKYTGAGAATALPCSLYLWEDQTSAWYLIGSGSLVAPGTSGQGVVTTIACLALADNPALASQLATNAGSLTVLVIVSDNASGNGTYDFIVAPNLS